MKKEYEIPQIDVILLDENDVITSSVIDENDKFENDFF